MNTETMNYGSYLRDQERDLGQIDKDRDQLEEDILRMQMELLQLADRKVTCLQLHAMTKKAMKLPLTEEEKKYLPEGVAPTVSIPSDVFKGMRLLEAATALLLRFGVPTTHREMLEGLRKGGLDAKLKNLDSSLRSGMQRSGKFKWFKDADGTYRWALPQWVQRSPLEAAPESDKPNLTLVNATEAVAKSA